jgi:hypothetical protein
MYAAEQTAWGRLACARTVELRTTHIADIGLHAQQSLFKSQHQPGPLSQRLYVRLFTGEARDVDCTIYGESL